MFVIIQYNAELNGMQNQIRLRENMKMDGGQKFLATLKDKEETINILKI